MSKKKRDEDEETTRESEEVEEESEEETAERRLLTREDVLERLRDCWEVCDFRKGRLSRTDKELLDMNLYIARLFTEVQESSDVSEVSSAIGSNMRTKTGNTTTRGIFPTRTKKRKARANKRSG